MKIILANSPHRLVALVLGMALGMALPTLASTVYRTVDDNGVVSFSDTPPDDGTEVETLNIDARDPQLSEQDRERLESMRETTDRMAQDRREREQHRANLRQAETAQQTRPDYAQPAYSDYSDYSRGYYSSSSSGGYYGYPARPWRPGRPNRPGKPGHPGYRPKPEHPIARPPLRAYPESNAQINRGSNAQLMRPIVSPRR